MEGLTVPNGLCGDWRLPDDDFLASWRLPGVNEKPLALKQQHPMPRESRIEFEEATHAYTIDGNKKAPRSVTGLVHAYEPGEFNAQAVVAQMKRGRRWVEKRVE